MSYFLQNKHSSAAVVTIILSCLVPTELKLSTVFGQPVFAQDSLSTSFELPQTVPSGTEINISGPSSMAAATQIWKEQFENKYVGTQVNIQTTSTQDALAALQAGNIDLAAIGRPLTEAEANTGITAVTVSRPKIAIIVAPDSPFQGSLNINQFAQIFRGEIQNWSAVGGSDSPVKLVDRPLDSDVRQALQRYSVFQSAPFEAGGNAVTVSEDSTEAVIADLGEDGIGYAIATEVINNPKVRILQMHETLPTNPSYPFSQPLGYAYQSNAVSSQGKAFLGFVSAPENQATINAMATSREDLSTGDRTATGISNGITDTESTNTTPASGGNRDSAVSTNNNTETGTTSPINSGRFNPWWLAPLALVPLLWWGLGRNKEDHEITSLSDVEPPASPIPSNFTNETSTNLEPTLPGQTQQSNDWASNIVEDADLSRVDSANVRVDHIAGTTAQNPNRLILVSRSSNSAYAYWDISAAQKAEIEQQLGQKLILRLYDVSQIEAEDDTALMIEQFETESDNDLIIPLSGYPCIYQAELGYIDSDGAWRSLAQSNALEVQGNFATEELMQNDDSETSPGSVTIPGTLAGSLTNQSRNIAKLAKSPENAADTVVSGMEATIQGIQDTPSDAVSESDAVSDIFKTVDTVSSDPGSAAPLVQETVSESVDTVISGAGSAAQSAQDKISDGVANATSSAETVISGLGETAQNLQESATNTLSGALSSVDTVISDVGSATPSVQDKVSESVDTVISGAGSAAQSAQDKVSESVDTVISGAQSAQDTTAQGISGAINRADTSISSGSGKFQPLISDIPSTAAEAAPTRTDGLSELRNKPQVSPDTLPGSMTESVQPSQPETPGGNLDPTVNSRYSAFSDLGPTSTHTSRVLFIARSATEGYAYWELSTEDKAILKPLGSHALKIRLFDVTNLSGQYSTPRGVYQADCQEFDQDQHITIPNTDRDYMVEIGYTLEDGRWVAIASSEEVYFSSEITRLL